ncbi:MAG TPA: beta-sandwich domain-containing protein [Bdellovibrio sp.]|uniref:beta-sandwich domain-containing protein n=1 Tax=Bdellovibrio sp. TaxID=28201 RepID=UPI002F083EFD
MKPSLIVSFLTTVTLLHSPAHAQVLTDLPDPSSMMSSDDSSSNTQTNTTSINNTNQNRTSTQDNGNSSDSSISQSSTPPLSMSGIFNSTATIPSVSRKGGGTVYHFDLQPATFLSGVQLTIKIGKAKIYSVTALTRNGGRVELKKDSSSSAMDSGSQLQLYVASVEDISAIEIRAESFGSEAAIDLSAYSDINVAKLILRDDSPVKPPTPVAPPVVKPAVTVGDRVLWIRSDGNAFYGTVLEIFQSGDARVQFDGYSGIDVIKVADLGKRINCALSGDRFCTGERVLLWTDNYYAGTAISVYSNGYATIVFDGYAQASTIDVTKVSRAVQSSSGISVGDRVGFTNGDGSYIGTVKQIYQNDLAFVLFDGYTTTSAIKAKNLFRQQNCSDNGICVGSRAIFQINGAYYPGVVKNAFSNGQVAIIADGYTGLNYADAKSMGRSVSRLGNLNIGDRLEARVGDSDYLGIVRELFSNNVVKIQFDGYTGYNYLQASEIGKQVNCEGASNICTGDRVVWRPNGQIYTGTVRSVYLNGKIAVQFDGYTGINILNATEVSK